MTLLKSTLIAATLGAALFTVGAQADPAFGLKIVVVDNDHAEYRNAPHGERHYRGQHHRDEAYYGSRAQHTVDKRQARQEHRIREGIRSGELTHAETHRLQREQQKIARLEDRFLSDGRLSKHERRRLDARLDRASDRIIDAKQNDRRHADTLYVYRY